MAPQITKAQAIEAYGGNASALARDLKLTPQAIYQWPEGPIAEGYALKLAYVLRPEIFGPRQDETARQQAGEPPGQHRSKVGWEEGCPSNASLGDDAVAAPRAAKVA